MRFAAPLFAAALLLPLSPAQAAETCLSYFGIGEMQEEKCEPFAGEKATIKIDQLANFVADTSFTRLKIVSDDRPDEPFDLSPLAGVSHIRTLEIYREGEVDLTPINAMQGLKSLGLSIDAARALPQLAAGDATGPDGLAGLRLYGPRDTFDLAPLAGWGALRLLSINGSAVTGTPALGTLTGLSEVNIDIKQPADFTPLAAATGLRRLVLRGVLGGQAVSDIGFLAKLTELRSLTLVSNRITDLTPLRGLTGLRTLILSKNTALTDLSPLSGLTELRNLQLRHTAVSDLGPLRNMSALRILWLDKAPVSDISVVANMPEMFGLEISRTQVSDVTPLAGLKNLEHLSTRGAPVSDFAPVPAGVKIKK